MSIKTIILAAGQGTRMKSAKPKILHKIADKCLLQHVYDMSKQLENNTVTVVYGHGAEMVLEELQGLDVNWVEQKEQLGTGHAVQQTVDSINDEDTVLILYGDVPLLKLSTVQQLISQVNDQTLALLTVILDNPTGYGRIIRDSNQQVIKIVEQKDTTAEEKLVSEGNTGILAVKGKPLKKWLSNLENSNAQEEYYLTDIIEMAVSEKYRIATSHANNIDEVLGVNNKNQLSHLERVFQLEKAGQLMQDGVTLRDPTRFDLRGEITALGTDIEIDINVILEGKVSIGNHVRIGANTIIKNAVIADNVEILPNTLIEDATIGASSRIGPYARIRPKTELGEKVNIGNFVEIKKTKVADGSKINHLSYIGDAQVGSKVNIGAGTITCNYDGVNKFQTIIEDGAFIGSDSQLIAPVTVRRNATIGAGSTITKDTPEEQLTLTRSKQVSISTWQRPTKKEK
jgi:bifunctional UDP-N-acetylglucosamine pyrophosphorylase/glucosamine-1-phosphate N-acetyltransferase